jgi:hypothetical protein
MRTIQATRFSEIKTPPKRASVVDGCIVFQGEDHYYVPLESVTSHKHLCQWIIHLSEKIWVTPKMIGDFVWLVCKEKGWPIYGENKEAV